MDSMLDKIIGIAIAVVIVVAMLPSAFEQFFAVDTSNWSAVAQTLWALIPVFAIIALALMFLGYVKYKRGR
jgi:uncharacterized membrane protein